MKAAVVKTELNVYVLCERKSLLLIQNSIILRPFTAVVTQIIIFWVITPCRRITFLTFQRYVLPPPSRNWKKIFVGFKKNVFVGVMSHERGGARCTLGRREIHSKTCLEKPEGTT